MSRFIQVRRGAFLALAMWFTAPPFTHAQQSEAADAQQAQQLFEAGEEAYAQGAFDDALAKFERSYRARPVPRALLRIGEAAEAAGRRERAVDTYKAYLLAFPNAPKRATVELRVSKLQNGEPELQDRADADKPAESSQKNASKQVEPRSAQQRPSAEGTRWTAEDEEWYRRNRNVRIAGRIVTALGGLLMIAGLVSRSDDTYDVTTDVHAERLAFAGVGLYALGSASWAASTLYGTNESIRFSEGCSCRCAENAVYRAWREQRSGPREWRRGERVVLS